MSISRNILPNRPLILVVGFLVVVGLTSTFAKDRPGGIPVLRPGQTVSGAIRLSGGHEWAATYRFTVTDSMFAVEFVISESPTDLDIYLIDQVGDVAAYSEHTDFNEELFLSRVTDLRLNDGQFTVEIWYQYDMPPEVDGELLRSIPFDLTVRVVELEPIARLTPGDTASGVLLPENGMMALYEVEIAGETPAFRLDLSDTDGDLDLFVHYRRFPSNPYLADYQAQTLMSTESLVISAFSAAQSGASTTRSLESGSYYVMVVDQITAEYQVPYTLSVTTGDSAPDHLIGIVPLPVPTTALERALLSTVELSVGDGGGSGCIVSETGLVLTNWHVVRDASGEAADEITVGFSIDHSRPPAERFRARVVDYVEEIDLALVQIETGRYGEQIPADFRFPYFELAEPDLPRIGQQLHFIGYPSIGGSGSRASVTYTSGIVAGYQHTPHGTLVKSDGEVNPGNSGGAALDSEFRLVGIPSSTVGDEAGQLAYIVPISAVPEEWLEQIDQFAACDSR